MLFQFIIRPKIVIRHVWSLSVVYHRYIAHHYHNHPLRLFEIDVFWVYYSPTRHVISDLWSLSVTILNFSIPDYPYHAVQIFELRKFHKIYFLMSSSSSSTNFGVKFTNIFTKNVFCVQSVRFGVGGSQEARSRKG